MPRIRTRFAPSPTGYLHVGSLRTALYAYYVARQAGGDFLLRVEDTDQEREVPGAVAALIRTFQRVDLSFDEGPTLSADGVLSEKGNYGPYTQSKRLSLYTEYAKNLLASGHAYLCFCTKERLDEVRKIQEASKQPMKYDRACLTIPLDESTRRASAGEAHVVRLRVPQTGFTETTDAIRGQVRFPNQDQEDFVMMKSDGFPTYHLANVVDDHLMEISHVIRGEEWLSSLPKHYQLYEAFGWTKPVFAHLPLILNPDKTKLSKRQGDVAVEDFLAKGYLSEALENFISLIGYNPTGDRELYAREELIKLFDLSKVNSSGGVFNVEKLNWMNQQYIQKKTPAELADLAEPFLKKDGQTVDRVLLEKICAVERNRLTTLDEIPPAVILYQTITKFEPILLIWKKADAADAKKWLQAMHNLFVSLDARIFDDVKTLETEIANFINANGAGKGNVLWPLRVALSGRAASPSPFEMAWVLGKDESIKRLQHAIALL